MLVRSAVGPSIALFCLNVQLCVKPERRADFLECIRNNQRCTRSDEPLNARYLFGEDEQVPNRFHFFESYESEAGFTHHTQTPHFAVWETFAASDPFTAPPKVSFYTEDAPATPGPAQAAEGRPLYSLNARFAVKPEQRADFLAALRADRDGAVRTEPLAAAFTFGEDAGSPGVFHVFEAYAGEEGFAAHAATPHYGAWAALKATEPFAEPPEVSFYLQDAGQLR